MNMPLRPTPRPVAADRFLPPVAPLAMPKQVLTPPLRRPGVQAVIARALRLWPGLRPAG